MKPLTRRIAAWGASHVLGVAAWSALGPVVVAYGFLTFGTVGLVLASTTSAEDPSTAAGVIETVVLTALVSIQPFWSDDRPAQENIVRVFGLLGLVGWMLELAYRRITGIPERRRSFVELVKRRITALGIATLVLCGVLLMAMLSVEWAGDPPVARRLLQGGATAFGMGAIIFVASVPALITSLGIRAIQGPVARAIAQVPRERGSPAEG
jgi:hypothetical protein